MEEKKHKKKGKSSKKEKSGPADSVEDSAPATPDQLDEEDELHSLTHFAGDEDMLVEQMFAAIQGTKLEAMMPSALKAIPLQDLKLLCVHELRGMSKKRIVAIIEGNNMSDSSGSSDTDESEDEDLNRHKKSARHSSNGGVINATLLAAARNGSDKPMDIVELEMRARLIETMLKNKDPKENGANDVAVIKPEPLSDRSRSRSSSYSSYSSTGSDSGGRSRRRKHSSRRSRRQDGRRHRKQQRSASRDSRDEALKETQKKTPVKKTKITRKEFEDRMKKAKENRHYRSRKDSEDDDERKKRPKQEEEEDELEPIARPRKSRDRELVKKEAGEMEDDDAEREEGEIDSNEEGEVGSDGDARSDDDSPHRSRSGHRKKSRHSKKKSHKSTRREARKPVDKNLIHATLKQENLSTINVAKSKPGVENVDSEEDFDSPGTAMRRTIKTEEAPNTVLCTERTNVSFSFTKKLQPNIMQGTDLEFGRSKGRLSGPAFKTAPPPTKGGDQIVISSDSEAEGKAKKRKSALLQVNSGSQDKPMEIEDDSISTEKETDQNDLKLCEETVMKDILADIDEGNDDTDKSSPPKKQPIVKEEPADVPEDNAQAFHKNKSKSKHGRSKRKSDEFEQEILSAAIHGTTSSTHLFDIKSEPLDQDAEREESDTFSTNLSSLMYASVPKKSARSILEQSAVNDSEEGACSDQDTDAYCSSNVNERLNMEANDTLTTDDGGEAIDNPHIAGQLPTQLPELSDGVTNQMNKSDGEASESDEGLVDLPEEEHFEVEDDSQSKPNYQADMSFGADVEQETDFYRGADKLEFSAENSRSGFGAADTESIDRVASDAEPLEPLEEVEDNEEEDAGLVELQPDEAEELTAVADIDTPVRKQGNTEIIGEIEPAACDSADIPNIESGSSWSTRWLQSEKVQKVVTSSKMLSRMRKRIKKDKLDAKTASPVPPNISSPHSEAASTDSRGAADTSSDAVPVIGSLEEYQRFIAGQEAVVQATSQSVAAPHSASVPAVQAAYTETPQEQQQEQAAPDKKADSTDESEDDELWSKMMGN